MLVRPAFLKLKRREKSKLCFSFPFNSLELNNLYVTNIPWPDTVSGDCQIASIVAASVVIVSYLCCFYSVAAVNLRLPSFHTCPLKWPLPK